MYHDGWISVVSDAQTHCKCSQVHHMNLQKGWGYLDIFFATHRYWSKPPGYNFLTILIHSCFPLDVSYVFLISNRNSFSALQALPCEASLTAENSGPSPRTLMRTSIEMAMNHLRWSVQRKGRNMKKRCQVTPPRNDACHTLLSHRRKGHYIDRTMGSLPLHPEIGIHHMLRVKMCGRHMVRHTPLHYMFF